MRLSRRETIVVPMRWYNSRMILWMKNWFSRMEIFAVVLVHAIAAGCECVWGRRMEKRSETLSRTMSDVSATIVKANVV